MRPEDLCEEALLLPGGYPVTSPAPPARGGNPAVARIRDPAWLAFELDVREARTRLKHAALAQLDTGRKPPRIDVVAVTREAGRSRGQLYRSHGHLVPLIVAAQAALERLTELREATARKAAARPSRSALEAEVRLLKAKAREKEAEDVSRQTTKMFELLFPRDGERAAARIAKLEEELAQARAELRQFRALNQALVELLPGGLASRLVVDGRPVPFGGEGRAGEPECGRATLSVP